MSNDIGSVLEIAGLTPTESKALLALLRSGPSTASEVAKNAGLFRRQAYDALDRLVGRNLASYVITNRKRIYSATETQEIAGMLRKKAQEINNAVPLLAGMIGMAPKDNITILRGIKGIKMMLETTMAVLESDPKRNTYHVLRTDLAALRLLGNWLRRWHNRRAKLGLNTRMIFTEDAAWRGVQLRNLGHTEIRYIKERNIVPVGLHSCGDYAWIIWWGKDSPFSVQIKDAKIARAFDEYFGIMWGAASPVPPEEAIKLAKRFRSRA